MPERPADVEVLPPETGATPPRPPQEARTWAMLCHLSSYLGYVFPFGHILGPLAVWLFKGEKFPLVDDQGKESLNFQLSITIYLLVAAIFILVVIGFALIALIAVFHFIVVIIAAVRAKDGEKYRYPLTIRFVR